MLLNCIEIELDALWVKVGHGTLNKAFVQFLTGLTDGRADDVIVKCCSH